MIEPAARRLNGRMAMVMSPSTISLSIPVRRGRTHVRYVGDVRYLPEELMRCHTSVGGQKPHNVWNVSMGQTKESALLYPAAA
jgi:hypothetical protein